MITDTVTGVVDGVVVPSPNCPKIFPPQHLTLPSFKRAQLKLKPVEMAMALEIPLTATGEDLFVVEPSPSCPSLLNPQHLMVLSDNNAHE